MSNNTQDETYDDKNGYGNKNGTNDADTLERKESKD